MYESLVELQLLTRTNVLYSILHTGLKMSIDKFGRRGGSTSTGKPPPGFLLTADGNFDMDGKILHNVADPRLPADVVTKKHLDRVALTSGINTNYDAKQRFIRNVLPPVLPADVATKSFVEHLSMKKDVSGHYDVGNKRIVNLRSPLMSADAVPLGYVDTHFVKCTDEVIDAKKRRITNVTSGEEDSDVVTNGQLRGLIPYKKSKFEWDFENHKITNVHTADKDSDVPTYKQMRTFVESTSLLRQQDGDYNAQGKRLKHLAVPYDENDAVTKQYMEGNALTMDPVPDGNYNAKHKVIMNVRNPEGAYHAVNLKYMLENTLSRHYDEREGRFKYSVHKHRIINLEDPVDMLDAVNINYLIRVLSAVIYGVYHDLASLTHPMRSMTKEDWIRVNLVEMHFLNENTKVRSRNN